MGVWNVLFATLQLLIGVGLLFRRTVRPAIVVMAIWAFGVWWLGEGFGGLLSDTASPLMGAPGAVVFYPLIGILVWPRDDRDEKVRPGIASSAAASGPLGVNGPLYAWSGFWLLSAALWLFPANRSGGAARSMVASMASGEPSWYAHFLTSVAHALPSSGSGLAWTFAVVSLVVGLGPLISRRPLPFLALGALVQLVFWVTGMALGGMLTGLGTDPNIAPLVVLLAVAMVPTLSAVPDESPGSGARHAPSRGFGGDLGSRLRRAAAGRHLPDRGRDGGRLGVGSPSSSTTSSTSAMAGMDAPSSHSGHSGDTLSMPGMAGRPIPTGTTPARPCPSRRSRC